MKQGYQAQTEMNSIWKSLETEVIDDIRNHTATATLSGFGRYDADHKTKGVAEDEKSSTVHGVVGIAESRRYGMS